MLSRECFVKYIIAWPPLGEADVPFALERIERAQEHLLAGAFAAKLQERVQRGERRRSDPPIGDKIGIVSLSSIERGKSALEKRRRHGRPHVDAGVEYLRSHGFRSLRDLVEPRPEPVEALIDRRGFIARQLPHCARIAVCSGNGLGNSKFGRPATIAWVAYITALPLDQRVDQLINVHSQLLRCSRVELM